jgi:hypothetical protein
VVASPAIGPGDLLTIFESARHEVVEQMQFVAPEFGRFSAAVENGADSTGWQVGTVKSPPHGTNGMPSGGATVVPGMWSASVPGERGPHEGEWLYLTGKPGSPSELPITAELHDADWTTGVLV